MEGIGILLPSGDIKLLEMELEMRAAVRGKGGGYLMAPAHIIQADTSADTVEKMIQIIKKR